MSLKITRCKYANHASVLANVSYHIEKWDLHINECKIIRKADGSMFVSMPSRSYQDSNGATKYANYIFFGEKYHSGMQRKMIEVFEEYMRQNPPEEARAPAPAAADHDPEYIPF